MGTFWPIFFIHGDVLTNFLNHGDVLTNLGTFWLGDVLTRGRFDCNPFPYIVSAKQKKYCITANKKNTVLIINHKIIITN